MFPVLRAELSFQLHLHQSYSVPAPSQVVKQSSDWTKPKHGKYLLLETSSLKSAVRLFLFLCLHPSANIFHPNFIISRKWAKSIALNLTVLGPRGESLGLLNTYWLPMDRNKWTILWPHRCFTIVLHQPWFISSTILYLQDGLKITIIFQILPQNIIIITLWYSTGGKEIQSAKWLK